MTSIYCYGDITYEQHLHIEEYNENNDTLVKSLGFKAGGSAFNTSNALAKMGHKVNLICSLGKDIEGTYLKKVLSNIENINTDFVDYRNSETSKVFALINNSKEHKFLSFRCNFNGLKKIVEKIDLKKNDILNISGYTFQNQDSLIISEKLIEKSLDKSSIISIDPSFNYAKNFNKFYKNYPIDYFFPNLEEARIISGVNDYKEAANILHKKNIKNVLITLSEYGCYFSNSEHKKLYKSNSFLDRYLSIGAGDNFVAGFISAKVQQLSIKECIESANEFALSYLKKNK